MVTPITLNVLEQSISSLIKVHYNRVPQNSSVYCALQCINMLSPFVYTIGTIVITSFGDSSYHNDSRDQTESRDSI